jgi:hypothetical protein
VFIKKSMNTVASFSKKQFSPETLAARLAPPFILLSFCLGVAA